MDRFTKSTVVLALVGLVLAQVHIAGGQEESAPIPPFRASAAALGAQFTVTVPGAPATDTPIDGGGPTAQVALDSIGSSSGYAAFPDPGGLAISGPGLVVGLLASGAAGLPPIPLPEAPGYPFYVASDANSGEQSQGAGPYNLQASSTTTSSEASASAGFTPDVVGNAGLSKATASITASGTGVVAKATSKIEALTIGPLTIGEVRSTAIERLDPSGAVTPEVNLALTGLRIGGVPFKLTPQGFVAGGPTYPAPINPTLKQVLDASGITVEFVAAQRFADRVIAPAVRITAAFDYAPSGKGQSMMTLTFGFATAAMTGAGAPAADGAGAVGDVGTGSDLGSVADTGAVAEDTALADTGSSGLAAGTGATNAGAPTAAPRAAGAPTAAPRAAGAPTAAPRAAGAPTAPTRSTAALEVRTFDIGRLYFLLVLAALAAFGVGQCIRLLGGRRSWTFLGG